MVRRLAPVSGRMAIAVLVSLVLLGGAAVMTARHQAAAQPPEGPPEGFPGMGGFFPPMFGGGGFGMIVHRDCIFIAEGGVLYKIDPAEMKVLGKVRYIELPPPPPPPQQ